VANEFIFEVDQTAPDTAVVFKKGETADQWWRRKRVQGANSQFFETGGAEIRTGMTATVTTGRKQKIQKHKIIVEYMRDESIFTIKAKCQRIGIDNDGDSYIVTVVDQVVFGINQLSSIGAR